MKRLRKGASFESIMLFNADLQVAIAALHRCVLGKVPWRAPTTDRLLRIRESLMAISHECKERVEDLHDAYRMTKETHP